jgi:hypothetical protein
VGDLEKAIDRGGAGREVELVADPQPGFFESPQLLSRPSRSSRSRGAVQLEQAGLIWTVPFPQGSTLGGATREVAADFRELASRVPEYRGAN